MNQLPGHAPTPATAVNQTAVTARLRLYIARSTPNSMRAELNLQTALKQLDRDGHLAVEIIDVFSQPKRAITDGVIVTPTLIGITPAGRITMMGDLTDSGKLKLLLESLQLTVQ